MVLMDVKVCIPWSRTSALLQVPFSRDACTLSEWAEEETSKIVQAMGWTAPNTIPQIRQSSFACNFGERTKFLEFLYRAAIFRQRRQAFYNDLITLLDQNMIRDA